MSKFEVLAEIKQHPASAVGDIVGIFFVPWVSMLATGALGHRYGNNFLQHIGYWDIVLARIATSSLRTLPVTRWVIGRSK